jgi:putative transposase
VVQEADVHGASWRGCRTRAMRNALGPVPKGAQPMVAAAIRRVPVRPDPADARETWRKLAGGFRGRWPRLAQLMDAAEADLLAYLASRPEHGRQVWSTNPQQRLSQEAKRRTDLVGISPNEAAVIRLVGSAPAEQHDERAVARRYLGVESLAKLLPADSPDPLPAPAVPGAAA